jgi:hypothetical protein
MAGSYAAVDIANEMLREGGVEIRLFSRADDAITKQTELYVEAKDPASGFIR